LAHFGVVLGVFGGGRRRGVIQRNSQPLRIFNPLNPNSTEYFGNGGAVIVA
jgi:hypothetical protein